MSLRKGNFLLSFVSKADSFLYTHTIKPLAMRVVPLSALALDKKPSRVIISTLCKRKGVEIIEADWCVDHIHMLVRILPNISVSTFMGYLKGKSSLLIFDRHANLKYKYGNRKFWCRGYYVDTCGKNAKKIQEYIKISSWMIKHTTS